MALPLDGELSAFLTAMKAHFATCPATLIGSGEATGDLPVPADAGVCAALERESDEYLVLHDVRCQADHIAQVVLSRRLGAFVIDDENFLGSGTLAMAHRGSAVEKELLTRARFHSVWLEKALMAITGQHAGVTPIVISGASEPATARTIGGVTFAPAQGVVQSMREHAHPLPSMVWDAREQIAAQLN